MVGAGLGSRRLVEALENGEDTGKVITLKIKILQKRVTLRVGQSTIKQLEYSGTVVAGQ